MTSREDIEEAIREGMRDACADSLVSSTTRFSTLADQFSPDVDTRKQSAMVSIPVPIRGALSCIVAVGTKPNHAREQSIPATTISR